MKHLIRSLILIAIITSVSFLSAQTPPHPNGGGAPATGNNTQVGGNNGGAPIGSGNIFLFILALAYAGRKVYGNRIKVDTGQMQS